jgi:hypothetical protein
VLLVLLLVLPLHVDMSGTRGLPWPWHPWPWGQARHAMGLKHVWPKQAGGPGPVAMKPGNLSRLRSRPKR